MANDSAADQDEPVQVAHAFLANYAEVRDGLAYVTGGFPEWWTVPGFPCSANLVMVLVLEMERKEAGETFHFLVRLKHPHGDIDTLVKVGTTRGLRAGEPEFVSVRQVVTVMLKAEFRSLGPHEFKVVGEFDGIEYATVPIGVVQGGPG